MKSRKSPKRISKLETDIAHALYGMQYFDCDQLEEVKDVLYLLMSDRRNESQQNESDTRKSEDINKSLNQLRLSGNVPAPDKLSENCQLRKFMDWRQSFSNYSFVQGQNEDDTDSSLQTPRYGNALGMKYKKARIENIKSRYQVDGFYKGTEDFQGKSSLINLAEGEEERRKMVCLHSAAKTVTADIFSYI